MFSAIKLAIAGAIMALFGGLLLAGVVTQPSREQMPAVGASASATTQAEPTDAATSEPKPTAGVGADDTTTPVLLPGVDLITEEIEPGVYRVASDGARDLSEGVQDVTVTPGGEVWVELGKKKDWDIVRLGEPGVSRKLGRKEPWQLFTLNGAPTVTGGLSPWRAYDGEGWVDFEPTECDLLQYGATQGAIVADGGCWVADGGLARVDDEGGRVDPDGWVDPEEIGLGPEAIMVSAAVADDGALWATVHLPRPLRFEGLVHYDGRTWERVPYEREHPSTIDDFDSVGFAHTAVGPDGTVWVVDVNSGDPSSRPSLVFVVRTWDGDAWMTYAPVEVDVRTLPERRGLSVLRSLLGGSMDARFLDDGRVWLLDGLLHFDADGLRSQELPGVGDLTFGPNGFAWTVAEGGLYVITPEAVVGTE